MDVEDEAVVAERFVTLAGITFIAGVMVDAATTVNIAEIKSPAIRMTQRSRIRWEEVVLIVPLEMLHRNLDGSRLMPMRDNVGR